MKPQLGAIRKTLSTLRAFKRLVIVSRVHGPHVLLHVGHLLSAEDTSRPLTVSLLHVRLYVDPALEHFST